MELLFKIILVIHILAGSIGLFTGIINIIRKKGDNPHFLVGKFFFYSTMIASIAGFVMSILHSNLFLLIIAVFTVYLTGTGQRFLSLKKLSGNKKPKTIDYCLTFGMILFAFLFIIYGFYLISNKNNFGIILIIFGCISFLMTSKDLKMYKGKIKYKNYWLLIHIQRMVGACIASITAFLVVINTYLPAVVVWLLPTVILTPLIFKWSREKSIKQV